MFRTNLLHKLLVLLPYGTDVLNQLEFFVLVVVNTWSEYSSVNQVKSIRQNNK